jgi:hypothetical protein
MAPGGGASEGEMQPATIGRRDTNPDDPDYYTVLKSQSHLTRASGHNPIPTAVPPPIAANAGTLGVRHVLSIIGLPERGKPYIAKRLQSYLSFFHGAEVKIFDINDYMSHGPPGSEANAEALLQEMRAFMTRQNHAAGHNMDVMNRAAPTSPALAATPGAAAGSTEVLAQSVAGTLLVNEGDRRRKNVDSGKVVIL